MSCFLSHLLLKLLARTERLFVGAPIQIMASEGVLRDGVLKNVSSLLSFPTFDYSSIPGIMSPLLPSLRTFSKFISAYSPLLLTLSSSTLGGSPPTCSNPQTSCQNTTAVSNTCCFNSPGGLLLQTQFWDTDPATGPTNSWTIHGLWYVLCNQVVDVYLTL